MTPLLSSVGAPEEVDEVKPAEPVQNPEKERVNRDIYGMPLKKYKIRDI